MSFSGMQERGLMEPGAKEELRRWRVGMWKAGFGGRRREIMRACAGDILFWMNTFGWVLEPRPKRGGARKPKCVMLQTWDFQNKHVLWVKQHVEEQRDGLTEKSRDMTATWNHLFVGMHYWLFGMDCMMLVMSAKQELVDKTGNERAFFQKIDYMFERLPGWMKPKTQRRINHFKNWETGSCINGEATTPNVSVGDRCLWILLDEFAKVDVEHPGLGEKIKMVTADTTNCRMANSTPEGMDSGFFGMRRTLPKEDVSTLHWSVHPLKRRGLYRVLPGGAVEVLDEGYDFGEYKFVREIPQIMQGVVPIEMGLRSPWYDAECKRRGSKRGVAKELDINYLGSGDPVFSQKELAEVRVRNERAADLVGGARMFFPELAREFVDLQVEPMRVWFNPGADGKPPQKTVYTVGADIGTGTGASDTCFSAWDCWMKTKVAEYQSNVILPEHAALLFVEWLRWFTTPEGLAFGIWDKGGPGLAFGKRVVDIHRYLHVYYQREEDKRSPENTSDKPGFPLHSGQSIQNLVEYLRISLFNGECIVRSPLSYEQATQYVYVRTGIEHQGNRLADSESGKGKQHGDMVIADGLGYFGLKFQAEPKKPVVRMIPGSYGEKEQRALEAALAGEQQKKWYN